MSLPDLTTFGLPLTGAARSVVPRSAARPRIFSETAAETVEQSTMIWGEASAVRSPSSPTVDVLEVVGGRDHDEDDVAIGELRGGVDELGAPLGQRLRLGPGAVVDRHVVTGVQQAFDQRVAHASGADPPDARRLLVVSHSISRTRLQSVAILPCGPVQVNTATWRAVL